MSWTPPNIYGEPSDHILNVGWWEGHEDLGEPHTGKQLDDWIDKNHRCTRCDKIIRTHQQASLPCEEEIA
jgi:hypothetical protein